MIPLTCPRCGNTWIYSGKGNRAKCGKCQYDLYFQKGHGVITINWDLIPQIALVGDPRQYANQAYFFIDVWNCNARIAIMVISADGLNMKSFPVPGIPEITLEDMEDTILQFGGCINMSGHYPISYKIRDILQTYFLNQ